MKIFTSIAMIFAGQTINTPLSDMPEIARVPTEHDEFDKHVENIGDDTDEAYGELIVRLEQVVDPEKLDLETLDEKQKQAITDLAVQHSTIEIKNLRVFLIRDQLANYKMDRAVAEKMADNEIRDLIDDVWDSVFDTTN